MFFTLFKPYIKKYSMFCKKSGLQILLGPIYVFFVIDKYTLHFSCGHFNFF